MKHTLSKRREAIERVEAYNFCLECFSLGSQTRGEMRSTFGIHVKKNYGPQSTERTVLKLQHVRDPIGAYNFYWECFSLGGQTKRPGGVNVFNDMKIHTSLSVDQRALRFRPVVNLFKAYNFYLECFFVGGQTTGNGRRDTR